MKITLQQAQASLVDLLDQLSPGDEITILKDGIAVARLTSVPQPLPPRTPGSAKGLITIAPDFDDPLPDNILADFEQ